MSEEAAKSAVPATNGRSRKSRTATSDYNAASITVLEGTDPVRQTPGMFIGSTDGLGYCHQPGIVKLQCANHQPDACPGLYV